MKLTIDAERTIESDHIEGVYVDGGFYFLEMVSGRTHIISPVLYATVLNLMGNSDQTRSAWAG